MNRSRGFTLVEVVIVVSALTIAVVLSVLAARSWKNAGEQAATVAEAAASMEAFAKAAEAHVSVRDASFVLGTTVTITPAQLVAAAELDADTVASPLDQPFVAYVRRVDEKLKPRIVATERGNPSQARLDRLEMPPGANGLMAWQEEAARVLNNRMPTAAVISRATTVAAGAGGGWTKDLADMVPAPSSPALAVLINFPDLAFNDPAPPPPEEIDPGNCTVAMPSGAGLAVCPVDTRAVVSWPFCGRFNNSVGLTHQDVYSSALGALVVGSDLHTFRGSTKEMFGWRCSPWLGGLGGCVQHLYYYQQDAVAVLNGYEVGRNAGCVRDMWMDVSGGIPNGTVCSANYSNGAGNFKACRVTSRDPLIAQWGAAGKNILCCRSR